jgi:hypothetical protein
LGHTTFGWGLVLFGVWSIFFFGMAEIPRLPVRNLWFPWLNLWGFYLFILLLQEVFVLYRHLRLSIKVFLFVIMFVTAFLPLVLFRFFQDTFIYLHSPMGYMANLISPFLVRGGNAGVQWRVFGINMLLCAIPLALIISKYRNFFKLRKQM